MTGVAKVILLLRLVNESTGTLGCPLFGIIWNPFDVSSRLMLVPSESVKVNIPAEILPPRWRMSAESAPSLGTEFFAENDSPLPFAAIELPIFTSALLMWPVKARSLNVLDGSLLEVMFSGPR